MTSALRAPVRILDVPSAASVSPDETLTVADLPGPIQGFYTYLSIQDPNAPRFFDDPENRALFRKEYGITFSGADDPKLQSPELSLRQLRRLSGWHGHIYWAFSQVMTEIGITSRDSMSAAGLVRAGLELEMNYQAAVLLYSSYEPDAGIAPNPFRDEMFLATIIDVYLTSNGE